MKILHRSDDIINAVRQTRKGGKFKVANLACRKYALTVGKANNRVLKTKAVNGAFMVWVVE